MCTVFTVCVCTVYTTHRLLKYSEHWLTDLITVPILLIIVTRMHITLSLKLYGYGRKIKFTLLLTYFTLLFLTDSRVGRFWVLRIVMLLEVPLCAKWITNIKNYFDPKTNKSYPFKGPSSKIPEGKILIVKKNIF